MPETEFAAPAPRRTFSIASTTGDSTPSRQPSPQPDTLAPDTPALPPSRTRSILNLTSSTLLGIYSSTGYAPDREDATTPWGTGAETPIDSPVEDRSRRRRSSVLDTSAVRTRQHELTVKRKRRSLTDHAGRTVILAAVGWGYGLLIGRLHDARSIAPVKVEGIPHHSYAYLGFWAAVAVVLGSLMPALDGEEEQETKRGKRKGQAWNDVVRSIGALMGIAFAIRRLPWESTLQLSLTLALSNPAVWYLLDRTATGFGLSLVTALTGTALCLVINPALIPAPSGISNVARNATTYEAAAKVAGLFTHESIGVATWIASVLFVSCICFGNIGRRL